MEHYAVRVLVVLSREDENAFKSFRNLTDVQIILAQELNTYDILCNDWIVFTKAMLPGAQTTVQVVTADE
jgi:large subunit ribosomal protein L4